MTPPAQTPVPQSQQPQQPQMPVSGFPLINPYAPGYFPSADMTNLTIPQQTSFPPEFLQMYMNFNTQSQMTFGAGIPVSSASFIPAASRKETTPSPVKPDQDSGNETVSPMHQAVQSNSLKTSPQFSEIKDPSNPLVAMQQQLQSMASPLAMNNILSTSSTSEKSSPTNKSGGEEQENMKTRRNTLPTASRRKSRPTPYERNQMSIAAQQMNPYSMMSNFAAALVDPYFHKDRCAVCGDNATGYHYDVMSCEGCKGFFRRSVALEGKYECSKGPDCQFSYENCTINRNIRNRCKACRYERCLKVGMNKDNVRLKPSKKDLADSLEDLSLSADVEVLVNAFKEELPTTTTLNSSTHAMECVESFVRAVPALNVLLPADAIEAHSVLDKIQPGLMTIRAAFSLDPVQFFSANNLALPTMIEKLRNGIRNSVLRDEGLAILSGIHILQIINGGAGEIFDTYCSGLRQHLNVTRTQENGAADRLLTKLGLLL